MRKSVILLGLIWGCLVLSACSEDKVERDSNQFANFEVQSHAFTARTFEDLQGEPWPTASEYKSHLSTPVAAEARFGNRMAIGDLNGNGKPDLVISENVFLYETTRLGRLYVYRDMGAASETLPLVMSDPDKPGLGVGLLVGPYCTDGAAGDSIIVSSPGANEFAGAIDVVRLIEGELVVTKSIKNIASGIELAGRNIAVGDVNGDGKPDLLVLKTPNDEAWLNHRLGVVLDFCNAGEELVFDAELDSGSAASDFGWSIYVRDLDGKGNAEIIVSEENYGESTPREGALHFYKYTDTAGVKAIVKSRDSLVGPSGAGLRSVSFVDIDGDGDLDLVVGMVATNHNGTTRNGSARTLLNEGPGIAFDMSAEALWSYENAAGHQYFGTSVLAVDVNNDGVRDLIVGAPARDSNSPNSKAVSNVAVFLGTKDGSVFSKEPYWRYQSGSPSRSNEDLGRQLVVANVNNKGWLDIFAAGKRHNPSSPIPGRVLNFLSTTESCYRADKCLIDGVCYDKGSHPIGNACLVCDPLKNNFEFVELDCSGLGGLCKTSSCDEAQGCIFENKADGTSCGEEQCHENTITTPLCEVGACVTKVLSCQAYVCVPDDMTCKTSCEFDDDCHLNTCNSLGECAIDLPPQVFINYPIDVSWNELVTIDASNSLDPEGFDLVFGWETSIDGIVLNELSYGVVQLQAPASNLVIDIQLTVSDVYGNEVVDNLQINVTNSGNRAPIVSVVENIFAEAGEVVALDASGSSDPDGDDLTFVWSVVTGEAGILSQPNEAIASFEIPEDAVIGSVYSFNVAVSDGTVSINGKVNLEVIGDPILEHPTITTPENGAIVGSPVTIKGKAYGVSSVEVLHSSDDGEQVLCTAELENNAWSCSVALDVGDYYITVSTIEAEPKKSDELMFSVYNLNIMSPEISAPINGEVISVKPTIQGTIEQIGGVVSVWSVEAEGYVKLCTAPVEDGHWFCISDLELLHETEYTLFADWQVNGESSLPSAFITVKTEKEIKYIAITSPPNGASLQSQQPVIIAGTAPIEAQVTVYLNDSDLPVCDALSNDNGQWFCPDLMLDIKSYTIDAVTLVNGQTYQAESQFEVVPCIDCPQEPSPTFVRGGSCSVGLTRAKSRSWIFALPLLLGLVILRRRRQLN